MSYELNLSTAVEKPKLTALIATGSASAEVEPGLQ